MKNVLVTGAAGRLGHYVIEHLLAEGNYRVTGFDQKSPNPETYPKGAAFVLGNLVSLEDCLRAVHLSQAEAIIHLGAVPFDTVLQPNQTGFSRIQQLPEDACMLSNTMGTYYLLDAARRFDVKTVVAASSYFVLGLGFRISDHPFQVEYLPIDEEHPLRPEDTYSLSKLLNEETLKAFSRAYGIRTVAFRLLGVEYPELVGKIDWYENDIVPEPRPDFVGGPIMSTYQYVDARDAAQAFRLAIEADNLEPFEAFYLGTDSRHREDTKDVVAKLWPNLKEMAASLEGTEGLITFKKLREKLSYQPQHSWRNKVEVPTR